jgi:hypothetical protein
VSESVQEMEGCKRHVGDVLKRRTVLSFLSLSLTGFAGQAHARSKGTQDWIALKSLSNFRQSGREYARLLNVTDRIWRTLGQPNAGLEVGVVETGAVRAEVLSGGKVWATSGFIAACQSEAELAAWFCQRTLAARSGVRGEVLDRGALETLLASGYDPRAVLTFWSRWATIESLRSSSRFKDIPGTSTRLGALRTQIEKLGYLF